MNHKGLWMTAGACVLCAVMAGAQATTGTQAAGAAQTPNAVQAPNRPHAPNMLTPEEQKDVKTAIGASRAEQARKELL